MSIEIMHANFQIHWTNILGVLQKLPVFFFFDHPVEFALSKLLNKSNTWQLYLYNQGWAGQYYLPDIRPDIRYPVSGVNYPVKTGYPVSGIWYQIPDTGQQVKNRKTEINSEKKQKKLYLKIVIKQNIQRVILDIKTDILKFFKIF